jgi:hypothetical protein
VDPEPDRGAGHEDDEVARQRTKHRVALLGRPVPGCPMMTIGDLAEQARAVSPAMGGADGMQRFLAEEGHSRETIAAVLDCLDLPGTEVSGPVAAVAALPGTSVRQQRLRALAQLEALLLEE